MNDPSAYAALSDSDGLYGEGKNVGGGTEHSGIKRSV